MIDPRLILETERRLLLDREGRVRRMVVDALDRVDRGPAPCCPPPCCACCWEAV